MFRISKLISILKTLGKNTPIYLGGHTSPDQDSVSSCLALQSALNFLGLTSYVLLCENDRNILSWQKNIPTTISQVTHKNYTFIALDLNSTDRLGIFEKDYLNASLKINIDHHSGNTTNADYVFSNDTSSSTCEIIYNLIYKLNKDLIDKNLASMLYAGIMTDTNCFSRRLTSSTLKIAQKLINTGIDYAYINRSTLWKRSKDEIVATGELAKNIKEEKHFKYVLANLSLPPFCNLTLNDLTKKVAEDLRKLDSLDIFLMLLWRGDNTYTGKIMTKTREVAGNIASLFGGGGHKKEAGFTVTMQLQDIINKINSYLDKN